MNEPNLPTALKGPRFEEAIRREAYSLWELDGRQDGRDLEYWLQAKEIVRCRLDENLGPPPTLAPIVIDKRTAPELVLAAEKPESSSVATAIPVPRRLAKKAPTARVTTAAG